MKKIFSISMVKNEIDIIEAFIRYHLSFFDGMVILDNGSTDGTTEIILNLINDGLPVYFVFDDNPAYNQMEITTNLFYDTMDKFDPDFILPLDVDEFLTSYNNTNIKEFIKERLSDNALNYLSWITYVPTEQDDPLEINVLKRIKFRRIEQHNYDEKVIIPTSIARKYKIKIKQGNHDLESIKGVDFKKNKISDLNLAHYPIRSINQAKSKYLVGWFANLARPKQVLFDWYYFYNIIKSGDDLTIENIKNMALYYDVINKNQKIETTNDPINLSLADNYSLKYTNSEFNYINNVLNYTEALAKRYSVILNLVDSNLSEKVNKYFENKRSIFQIIKDFMMIDGWLSPREACELYKTVKDIYGNNLVLAEIGTWLGRSSYVLAKAIEGKSESILYCVDPFDGCGDKKSEIIYKDHINQLPDKSLLNKFNDNMCKLGVSDLIRVIPDYSFNAIKSFKQKLDFLFIDGNHDYDSVYRDYEEWSPLVRPGGYIVFHDVGSAHTLGPKQVVEQYVVRDPQWVEQKLVDELYIAKKLKNNFNEGKKRKFSRI